MLQYSEYPQLWFEKSHIFSQKRKREGIKKIQSSRVSGQWCKFDEMDLLPDRTSEDTTSATLQGKVLNKAQHIALTSVATETLRTLK